MCYRWHFFLAIVLSMALSTSAFAQSNTESAAATPSPDSRMVPIEGQFGDGWQQTIALPETSLGVGDHLVLWVEDGWLCARHQASDGRFNWQIVLCQIDESVLPQVRVKDGHPFVEVSYRDGRYFVRESLDVLRAIRETSPGGNLLNKDFVFGTEATSCGWGDSRSLGIFCSSWRIGEWFCVAIGKDQDSWRAIVRLDPLDRPGGYGVSMIGAGHLRQFHGEDTWLIDDGELLVATRMLPAMYEAINNREKIRETILAGGGLPAIDAASWLNTDDVPTWESLQGKLVLVDFWGTWCGPCVAALPKAQALHEQFADRGFVVIGVHSWQAADTCAAFIEEHGYTFPVAVDSGKTAEAFAIEGWPTYFLIDRSGRVTTSYTRQPPTAEEIEALLDTRNNDGERSN